MKLSDSPFRVILFMAGCFFTMALQAQDESDDLAVMEEEVEQAPPLYTSEIEIGGGYVSEDDFKFGEYNGHEDKGGFGIANIRVRKFIPIGSSDKSYWELNGHNLALDSRSISAEYSTGPSMRLNFAYDQIPHNQFNDGYTPFIGAGTPDQTLPGTWVGGGSTTLLGQLVPNLQRFNVETERQRLGGAMHWRVSDEWMVNGEYQHENKDGSDVIGAVFGSNGGNPRSSVLIRPINYETDDFNVGLSYNGDLGQYSLSYHLSFFNNNDDYLRWDNPFDNPFAWSPGANFADGAVGQMGSEPDNKAQQLVFAGGYNFGAATRLTGSVTYGKMTQNQAFLPYSSVFPATIPLPRASLDGEIQTVYANVNLSSRLTNKLGVTARYIYDNKDNNTPQDIYVRIPGDAAFQAGLIDGNARINWPYSMERHKVELEASYNLMMATRLSVGYNFETIDRVFTEVDNTDEHTGTVRLTFSPFETASGWIHYQHAARTGSSYVSNQPVLTSHNPAYIGFLNNVDPDELYENDPLMRKFHIADRDRDQFAATLNFYPTDLWTFTVAGKYNQDNFDKTQIGLKDSSNGSVSFDAGYIPNKKVGFHAYFTYENYDYKQQGFYHPGFLGPLAPTTDRLAVFGDAFWQIESEDRSYSGGAGMDWNVIEDKFNVKMDFLASHTVTDTTPNSTGQAFLPIPSLRTDLYQFTLTGEYKFKPNMGARVKYLFEAFDTTDFALDGIQVNTLGNVILLGNNSPHYEDHVIGVSWFYNWQ